MEEEPQKLKHNFKDRESWQTALNKAPNPSLIKKRSLGGGKTSTYLPIEYQQALQDVFFDEFDVIDEKYQVVLNELITVVKCHGLPSYPNAEPRIFTGSSSTAIQCDSGAKAHLFPKGKKTNALEYNLPKGRTTAISKALETIGNIFGRNLGRAVEANYNMTDRIKNQNKSSDKKKKKKKKNGKK